MKKIKIYFTIALLLLTFSEIVAQNITEESTASITATSNKSAATLINYQAVARNAAGTLMTNAAVTIAFEIRNGAGGTAVFNETQNLNTDANGVFSAQIGAVNSLAGLDWANIEPWLQVLLNGSSVGETQMVSVPYALFAKNVEGAVKEINDLEDAKSNFGSIYIGEEAGLTDSGNHFNVGVGYRALTENTSGLQNTALGYEALDSNTSGNGNTALGKSALESLTTSEDNTGIGAWAGSDITTGRKNTLIGRGAGSEITTGGNNIAIGWSAEVPNATGSNQVRIGDNQISYAGVQVGWSITSDRRLKSNIETSNLGLNFIKELKPVVYERKNDETKKSEYGFIAQEVETTLKEFGVTNNGIITIDDDGMYGVRYNDLIAVLTKAMQEQQEVIENLQATVNKLLANRE